MVMQLSQRTGEVFIRNFDQGVVETLGGTVQIVPVNTSLGKREGYWVDIPGVEPMTVPIIFGNPEQIYERKIYPSFCVVREPPEPALMRWHSLGQLEYVAGVSGTEYSMTKPTNSGRGHDTISGYEQLETKPQAWPFDIVYDISCYARYEHEAIPMLKRILRVFQPYSKIRVIDSLGQERWYTVFMESGVQDIGEIVDVSDRLKAYTVTIRVEGELDLNDPTISDTVTSIKNNASKKKD